LAAPGLVDAQQERRTGNVEGEDGRDQRDGTEHAERERDRVPRLAHQIAVASRPDARRGVVLHAPTIDVRGGVYGWASTSPTPGGIP
jgi:hypothetical protein